jgi:hypothetical protein
MIHLRGLRDATVAWEVQSSSTAAPEALAGRCAPSRSEGTTRLVAGGFQWSAGSVEAGR